MSDQEPDERPDEGSEEDEATAPGAADDEKETAPPDPIRDY